MRHIMNDSSIFRDYTDIMGLIRPGFMPTHSSDQIRANSASKRHKIGPFPRQFSPPCEPPYLLVLLIHRGITKILVKVDFKFASTIFLQSTRFNEETRVLPAYQVLAGFRIVGSTLSRLASVLGTGYSRRSPKPMLLAKMSFLRLDSARVNLTSSSITVRMSRLYVGET
jgi:hypothetical protein